jgi:DNA-binding MarR family transcriptional regulator
MIRPLQRKGKSSAARPARREVVRPGADTERAGSGAAQSRIAYSVGRLERALRQRLGEVAGRAGLTVAQYTALSVLEARGALSNAELARRSFVTPQAMNEIIAAMTAKGMVGRAPDASHGRIVRISLTAEGERMLRQCDLEARQVEEEMLGGLSRADRLRLQRMLRTCVAALEQRERSASSGEP